MRRLAFVACFAIALATIPFSLAEEGQTTTTSDPSIVNEQAKLRASSRAGSLRFGTGVAMDGDTILVGMYPSIRPGDPIESVHAFVGSGNAWVNEQVLVPDDAPQWRAFGRSSVAVDGDTAVVGAHQDDNDFDLGGAAYVFSRTGGTWTQQQKLTAMPGDNRRALLFGRSVAISGDTIVVGADSGSIGGPGVPGQVHVYTRVGGLWMEEAVLQASDRQQGVADFFGLNVAIAGDTILVRSWTSAGGAVYVFERNGGIWTEQQKLTRDDPPLASNLSLAMTEDTAVIGEPFRDRAFVVTRTGSTWSFQQELTTDSLYDFGQSVAIFGDTIVVGDGSAVVGGVRTGRAHVFRRRGGVWSEDLVLLASDGRSNDRFGASVAVSGSTVVVGAAGDDLGRGSAYVFDIDQDEVVVADAGPDQTVECSGVDTAVELDGSASRPPTGLLYDWTGDFVSAAGVMPTVMLPVGHHPITLRVEAATGASDTDEVVIDVVDREAPAIELEAEVVVLAETVEGSPYEIKYDVDDVCDASPDVTIAPLLDIYPPGTTEVTVTATDASGNTASAKQDVVVRFDCGTFRPPVAPLPAVNNGRAGRTYPLKWQCRLADGTVLSDVALVTSLRYEATSCDADETGEELPAADAGSSGLRFAGDVYHYNWQTPTMPGCYRFFAEMMDRQRIEADFRLR